MTPPRRYLDNAATSWPKPDSVYQAVDDYQRRLGAPAGRGSYGEAEEVSRLVEATRRDLAELIGVGDSSRIVFCNSGTDALNQAILGWVRPGDHVVTSILEHNSVLRPLRWLREHRQVEVSYVECGEQTLLDPQDVAQAMGPRTTLVALTHASNVTGAIQPLSEIGLETKRRGVCFLVDASQSVGHWPVNCEQIGATLLAAPTHKGLLGPLGGGFLFLGPGVEQRLRPLRFGGTGTQSDEDRQPDALPQRFESGNLNVPAIAGLGAGVRYIQHRGLHDMVEHERQLCGGLCQRLQRMPSVRVWGPDRRRCTGVVSMSLEGYDPREVAHVLDSQFGVQARSGFHCAPRVHRLLGTDGVGGTVRFSVGPFSSLEDVQAAADAIEELTGS